jgi:hypothetical protein
MMPAHVARFAPDATAQVIVSCLGYKGHITEAGRARSPPLRPQLLGAARSSKKT